MNEYKFVLVFLSPVISSNILSSALIMYLPDISFASIMKLTIVEFQFCKDLPSTGFEPVISWYLVRRSANCANNQTRFLVKLKYLGSNLPEFGQNCNIILQSCPNFWRYCHLYPRVYRILGKFKIGDDTYCGYVDEEGMAFGKGKCGIAVGEWYKNKKHGKSKIVVA